MVRAARVYVLPMLTTITTAADVLVPSRTRHVGQLRNPATADQSPSENPGKESRPDASCTAGERAHHLGRGCRGECCQGLARPWIGRAPAGGTRPAWP